MIQHPRQTLKICRGYLFVYCGTIFFLFVGETCGLPRANTVRPYRVSGKLPYENHPFAYLLILSERITGLLLVARRSLVIGGSDSPPDCHSLPPCSIHSPNLRAKQKRYAFAYLFVLLERITGLEPATSTLARSRSTK